MMRGIEGLPEDGIERIREAHAGGEAIDRGVLVAVGDPNVCDRGGAELAAHFGADAAAGDGVLDPEAAHAFVVMAQGETVRGERMGEKGWVEIEAEPAFAAPVHPA